LKPVVVVEVVIGHLEVVAVVQDPRRCDRKENSLLTHLEMID